MLRLGVNRQSNLGGQLREDTLDARFVLLQGWCLVIDLAAVSIFCTILKEGSLRSDGVCWTEQRLQTEEEDYTKP